MSTNLSANKKRLTITTLLLTIFMLGMTLRLYRLDSHSLSVDEIKTAVRVQLDVRSLISLLASGEGGTFATQTPLMYIVTRFFMVLFDDSDFILRLQAMLFGSLSILLIYKAGQILWSKEVGLIGAVLLAVNPFHVRYSQNARHYGMMTFLALLSLIFLVMALRKGQAKLWIGFVLSTSLSLYNHYFAFLFLPAEVILAAWVITENWVSYRRERSHDSDAGSRGPPFTPARQALTLCASLTLVGVSYAPWLPALHLAISTWAGSQQVGLSPASIQRTLTILWKVLTAYTSAGGPALWLLVLLFALGLSTRGWKRAVLILLWIGAPFAFVLLAAPSHTLSPRHVLFTLPPYLLVIASGTVATSRILAEALSSTRARLKPPSAFIALLTVLALGSLSAAPLADFYARATCDWRAAAQHLKAGLLAPDMVFYPAPGYHIADDALQFYLRRLGVEPPPVLRIRRGLAQQIAQNLHQTSGQIWAVLYPEDTPRPGEATGEINITTVECVSIVQLSAPSGDLITDSVYMVELLPRYFESRLARFNAHVALAEIYMRTARFDKAESQLALASQIVPDTQSASRHLADTRLELEQVIPGEHLDVEHPLRRSLGLQLALLGYNLGSPNVAAGETVNISLWWEALAEMDTDYTAFIHAKGPDGQIWAQQDTLLQHGEDPTSIWELGKIVEVEYDLQLPENAPTGDYVINAGVYFWETQERLTVWDEQGNRIADDAISLGTIEVTK